MKEPTEEPATAATAATAAKGPAEVSTPGELDKSELVCAELLLDTFDAPLELLPLPEAPLLGGEETPDPVGMGTSEAEVDAPPDPEPEGVATVGEATLVAEAEVGTSSS